MSEPPADTTIQEGLVAYMAANVSSAGTGYPIEVPQDASYPAWSYQVIDDNQVLAHNGATYFHMARIQIDIIALATSGLSAYANGQAIATAMRQKLDGYKGKMGTIPVDYCKTTLNDDWAEMHKLPAVHFDVMINYRLTS